MCPSHLARSVCGRMSSLRCALDKTTHCSLLRPVRRLIKHRPQLSGSTLQGEREGSLPPGGAAPHSGLFPCCLLQCGQQPQLCGHLQPSYSGPQQLFRGPQGSCCPLGTDHTFQTTSERSRPDMENTKPEPAHSRVCGAPGPEDSTRGGRHQREGI